ncbi:bifunctional oligoribonuclease and PAP phosphatase NrnA [Spiroplasma helicoides]|uniref:Bifunctional oligoribonuclease and PAP phosphatase NrnA n=1 Tax=Spiroplasma helicoides TaxID=216938 RepID=A0A1B3SL47_9MOLU|nr:bifunctional oligoribonuclease/PAP phosphatase NrnA [Spiroplasma helicoides]AOG60640.1 bifunctional oligoribonuclease and PAP phosphatase NrnA [Spiroplasma helicoides]
MTNKLFELIKNTSKIVLLRHISPDFDAIGSQMSLYQFIHDNFENKTIKLGTSLPDEYKCIGIVDDLSEKDFEDALVIITDTATFARIDIPNFDWLKKAKTIFKIDHHVNVDKYADFEIVEPSFPATCELLTKIYDESNLHFSQKTAFYLYHGLVTDTDRFMYRNVSQNTFAMAKVLLEKGINIHQVYKNIYSLTDDEMKLKGYILSNFLVSAKKVAYIVLEKNILDKYNVKNPDKVALWVNMLGDIKDIKAWVFFVQKEDHVRVEFRSNQVNVRIVAESFNGGGHISASGAKIRAIEDHNEVILYFDKNIDKLAL